MAEFPLLPNYRLIKMSEFGQKRLDEFVDNIEDMQDYGARAKKYSLPEVEAILPVDGYGKKWAKEAVKTYEYVRREIDYGHTGSLPRNPEMQHKIGKGDCQDQTLMLATLWNSLMYVGRVLHVGSREGKRVVFEFECPVYDTEIDEKIVEIREVYREVYGRVIGNIKYEQDPYNPDVYWIVADPVHGEYLGDSSHLTYNGYIQAGSGSWEWVDLRRMQVID